MQPHYNHIYERTLNYTHEKLIFREECHSNRDDRPGVYAVRQVYILLELHLTNNRTGLDRGRHRLSQSQARISVSLLNGNRLLPDGIPPFHSLCDRGRMPIRAIRHGVHTSEEEFRVIKSNVLWSLMCRFKTVRRPFPWVR